jgi:Rieske Fe-S protein
LVVLGASSAAVACGSGDTSPFTSNNDPDNSDGGLGDTGGGTEAGVTDSGSAADTGACTAAPRDLGMVSSFGLNTWTLVGSGRTALIVGHDGGGIFVFSAICTHASCTVDPPDASGNTFCSCHGATFDGNGRVTASPARRDMPNYAATVCSGHVQVDTSKTVAVGTRVKV